MTLLTPCIVPSKSRWHLVTGLSVVVVVYVVAVALVKWSIG